MCLSALTVWVNLVSLPAYRGAACGKTVLVGKFRNFPVNDSYPFMFQHIQVSTSLVDEFRFVFYQGVWAFLPVLDRNSCWSGNKDQSVTLNKTELSWQWNPGYCL